MNRVPVVFGLLMLAAMPLAAQEPRFTTYEFAGGRWFDGSGFVRKTLYVVDGVFRERRPARVDTMIDLGDAYIVPPFGDAHTHAFENPTTIEDIVATNLRDGIFYALSLTNSIAGKRAVARSVNHPTSVDVAYADAGLTATRGHPIMSAEMFANRWPWDSLRTYYPLLLKSNRAEGDVYFIVDSLADLLRQWSRIVASRPDVIKIYLLDTDRFEALRADTTTLGNKGLDPSLVPAIVAEAHRSGLRVAAHIETAADFHVAISAGVDIIAHLPGLAPRSDGDSARYAISEADAARAAQKRVVVIPTAWLAGQERIARGDTAQVTRAKRLQRHNLELLARHGVRLAIGSDLFVNATVEATYLLGLGVFDTRTLLGMWSQVTPQVIFPGRRIGHLSAGYEASFLALSCDPIADFACTRQITRRMKQGRILGEKD